MKHKLANAIKVCKGNGNTTTLLFFLKGLEVLQKEKRTSEHHNDGTLQHHYFPQFWTYYQAVYLSVNQSINQSSVLSSLHNY